MVAFSWTQKNWNYKSQQCSFYVICKGLLIIRRLSERKKWEQNEVVNHQSDNDLGNFLCVQFYELFLSTRNFVKLILIMENMEKKLFQTIKMTKIVLCISHISLKTQDIWINESTRFNDYNYDYNYLMTINYLMTYLMTILWHMIWWVKTLFSRT